VSTTAGVEGIAAEPGRHLLVGDAPQFFADACLRLMDDDDLAASLAANAAALVEERYSQAVVNRLIAGWL
jgi:hypothetical protein